MMRLICGLLLSLFSIVYCACAAEPPLDIANIRVGCWVEYIIVVAENPKEKLVFNCFIKLYNLDDELLDFEYKIDGIGKRIEISREDFPLARLIPKINRATSFKESSEEKFVFTEMNNQTVSTVHDVWNYENGITEVWRSKEVPFSIVKVVCKDFSMELRAYSWAKE